MALGGGNHLSVVRQVGDPILRMQTREVTDFDDALRALEARMYATMVRENGVGLAAPQIGVGLAVFVMDCEGIKATVVNPKLRILDDHEILESEGCLSIKGLRRLRGRAAAAEITGFDAFGEPVSVTAEDLAARCLQHEYDHLQGRLFTDPVRS